MAWSNSKIFGSFLHDALVTADHLGIVADTVNAALFGNTGTPDQTVSSANSCYNAGQWVTGNETSNGGWSAGGLAITSKALTTASATITYSGANLANGSAATLSGVFGCLVYDTNSTTNLNQGICFNYFGGSQSVTAGTLTIVWNGSGIMAFAL